MLRGGARNFGAFRQGGFWRQQQQQTFRQNRVAFAAFRKFHLYRDFQLEHYRTTNSPPLGQSGQSTLLQFLSDLNASNTYLLAVGVSAEVWDGERVLIPSAEGMTRLHRKGLTPIEHA
uniref:Uncharacterized protein n=1 Tax=Chromera velia CCMP2878 TaxID=1169474 RepID=A0A0G4HHD4_9ALVE|eukprot:Cvel_6859.t1-p1 / transcript=Cvel_6859.t1 / gene=Cvel_6859 / organism=Chromera_velia_CCMP2878 / gene_product=hypothetical protein / transcript_product=hypothetical protein / location=Cvel_scaffold346:51175-54099(-) / protein_length=117 / sequence_SO=supercontig / SO=protein_coding / is_pseudo=false